MNSDRDRLAKEIFADALEREDASSRGAYLDAACGGNADLRAEVESLLRAYEQAAGFLVGEDRTPPEPSPAEGPGSIVGRYKLIRLIGEGGFGDVYLAEQLEPIRRRVAFKIVKLGMDTREVVARFEAERQALALMDHPNIAQVHDAGATPSGRPYFVMELVEGAPITDYCDRERLATDARLRLFTRVCHAVQHAHQKGVIHRDLKPANVLVTVVGGAAMPKVIDFGIAKALGQELTPKTLLTRFEQILGTPAYLSPEQAAASGVDVDTRSDVYTLGVLLYELLTGTTPVPLETLHHAALDEVRRRIRETGPPKPSTRLHALGPKLAAVARQRHAEPSTLSKLVRGDLDWIVMKCLEKDRRRRYETADALARDIHHHLEHEPVQASPPSRVYRIRKFIRRHRVGVSMAGAVSAALLLGLIGSLLGFTRANRERNRAVAAESLAANQRSEAEKEAEKARTTLDLVQQMFRHRQQGYNRGKGFTVEQRLDEFTADLGDKLKNQPGVEAEIGYILGLAYSGLGRSDSSKKYLDRALELRRRLTASNDVSLARNLLNCANAADNNYRAEQLADEAVRLYRAASPGTAGLADALSARAFFREYDGRVGEARQDLLEARSIAERLGEAGLPALQNVFHNLAANATMRGEFEETEALDRQALALSLQLNGPKAIETAIEARAVAGALLAQGDGAAAEPLLRDHLAVLTWAYGPQSEHLSRGVGLLRAALELQGNADPELETLDERFFRPAKLRQLADPGHASVLYRLRISSPGEYRLFLRWDGHDIMSDSLWAQLLELQDGPGGKSADGYAFIMPLLGGDADFATFPTWMGFADFEENAHSQWREHPFDVPATWTVPASGDYTLRITAFKGGTAFDAAILQLTNLPAPTGDGPAESAIATDGAFLEQNGGVVFEAEHFASRTKGEAIEAPLTIEWWVIPGEDPGDLAYLHYRGAGYVQALPDGTVDDPAELLHNRAFVQAQEGHYPEAIAYYSQAVQAAPDDLRNYYQLALACLGAGRLEAYRQAVARMRAQSGAEDPGLVPARIPGTYALGPQAVVDYAPIIAMAEEAIRRNPADPGRLSALRALGAVLYRAGRHSEALQRLAEAQAGLERLVSSLKSSSRAYAAYFQAMAHQRLGQPAEARQWFERARGWRQAFRSAVPATKPIAWIRRLPLDLLQREAADRLGAAATP